jgi:hypothetical protein
MRRRVVFAVAFLAMVAFMVTPGFAKMGAVKTVLNERMGGDPPNDVGSGETAGWAIFNTTCDLEECVVLEGIWLVVNIHLEDGMPEAEYDVYVKIDGTVNLVGQLYTNKKGKGNFHSMMELSDAMNEEVDVQAVVKPEGTKAIVGYATATEPVPVKNCEIYYGDE